MSEVKMAARKTIFAAGALAMLATPVVHAASNEDCSNFVFMDIITIHATESCNIDFMNDPGVVAMVKCHE